MMRRQPNTNRRVTLWIIGAVLLLILLPEGIVRAHAALLRSDPASGAALPQSPDRIVLEYSEELDPAFTEVSLLDSSGRVFAPGPGVIDPAQPRILQLDIAPLPDGVYSAVWQARSLVDGHVTNGIVGFSVGQNVAPVSLLPPVGMPDPATSLPDPISPLVRWLGYLSAALGIGSLLFAILVWQPVYRPAARSDADSQLRRLLQRLAWIGLAGLVLATLALAAVQIGQLVSNSRSPGVVIGQYLSARNGALLGMRLVLVGSLAWIVRRLPLPGGPDGIVWWAASGLGATILLTFSLQSHGAAMGSLLALTLDWLHLAAMAAWLGGLPALFFVLRWTRTEDAPPDLPPLDRLIPRFSLVALASIDILSVTGAYSLIIHVGSLDALLGTTYGQTLLVKLGLFTLLIGLGAINLLVITPRLAGTAAGGLGWLRRTVPTEIGIGLLVLLAAGLLTSVAPAGEALEAQLRLGFTGKATVEGVTLTLRIAPVQVGDNEFGVDVSDTRPGSGLSPASVMLRLEKVGQNLGVTEIETQPGDGNRFTARGSFFPLSGDWQVEVILHRPRFEDIVHRFTVSVESSGPGGGTPKLGGVGENDNRADACRACPIGSIDYSFTVRNYIPACIGDSFFDRLPII